MITQESIDSVNYQVFGIDELTRDMTKVIDAINAAGSGATTGDVVFVAAKTDLPDAVGGVITLGEDITYYFTAHVDLEGDRLVGSANTTILGASSENCSITSTGLNIVQPLFTTDYTTPIRHITFKDVGVGIEVNPSGLGAQPIALDWTGVNFSGCGISLICGEIDNFIFSKGAILSSGAFTFTDSVGTIGIDNSLFVGTGDDYPLIDLQSTCVVTRRFRVIYSSFIAFGSTKAINVDVSATVPVDSYILDTCNFSGGGTYLQGIGQFFRDNEPRWINNKGVLNTSAIGNYYMSNNATVTTITTSGVPVKVLGTTTANAINQKLSHSNNRLTYKGELIKNFQISAVASFTSGNNRLIGLYVAKNGTIINDSEMYATTSGSGRAESITIQTITELTNGDYIEIFIENDSNTDDITVEFLNVICKAIN
jgi:hypothetical protein